MKKISWIPSYPKSGNTYLRLFLSAYFYTNDGIMSDFKLIDNIFKISGYRFLKNVKNIPSIQEFIDNPRLISQYWEVIQSEISKKIENNLFIKTHDCMHKILDHSFTNEKITKCFLYIVRDPRSVAVSYSHHMGYDYEKTINYLINENFIILYKKEDMTVPELVSSWSIHYNSWKEFVYKGNGLIIKYEDLVKNPLDEFAKILGFLKKFISFNIDKIKLINSVESTLFENIKKLEMKTGFKEKPDTSKEFFRKGDINEWENILSVDQIKLIEKNFGSEMRELNYL